MSTKIYNGYKINVTGNILGFLKSRKETIVNARIELIKSFYTEEEYKSQWNDFYDRVRNIKLKQLRDPLVYFEFNITIFPFEDYHLAIIICEHKQMISAFSDCDEVEYFGYWNNSDPQEGFTDEQWEERGALWGKALGSTFTPAKEGLGFTYFTLDDFPVFPGSIYGAEK